MRLKVSYVRKQFVEFEVDSENYVSDHGGILGVVEFVNNLKSDPQNYYHQEKMMDPESPTEFTDVDIKEID